MSPATRYLFKTIAFRAVSFFSTLLIARLWFGDWHVSAFQVFLLFYCSAIYFGFEWAWDRAKVIAECIEEVEKERTMFLTQDHILEPGFSLDKNDDKTCKIRKQMRKEISDALKAKL